MTKDEFEWTIAKEAQIAPEMYQLIARKYQGITSSLLPRKMSELLTRLSRDENMRNRRQHPRRRRR